MQILDFIPSLIAIKDVCVFDTHTPRQRMSFVAPPNSCCTQNTIKSHSYLSPSRPPALTRFLSLALSLSHIHTHKHTHISVSVCLLCLSLSHRSKRKDSSDASEGDDNRGALACRELACRELACLLLYTTYWYTCSALIPLYTIH